MNRILAAALGIGLLAGGGVAGSAFASPAMEHTGLHATGRTGMILPVHDEDHRPHHVPPPRDWHRREPVWHSHVTYEHHNDYREGRR